MNRKLFFRARSLPSLYQQLRPHARLNMSFIGEFPLSTSGSGSDTSNALVATSPLSVMEFGRVSEVLRRIPSNGECTRSEACQKRTQSLSVGGLDFVFV